MYPVNYELRPSRHRAAYSRAVIGGRANSLGDEAVTCEWLPIQTQELRNTRKHKFTILYVVLINLFWGGFGNDCKGLQEYMMLLDSFVHCLLSLWVRGAPTRSILGAFRASLGSLGLPSGAFEEALGCFWD